MPGFAQSLEGQDLGHLEMVASVWGIELSAKSAKEAIKQLSIEILNADLIEEVVDALTEPARQAVLELTHAGGRMPWTQFVQRFGELRPLGPGRRDKAQPHRKPASASESLWYRGMVARAFFDTPDGPKEFAYIPEDLAARLPIGEQEEPHAFGRPARPAERSTIIAANDRIVDEACTLLAGLRMGLEEDRLIEAEDWQMPPGMLKILLQAADLVDGRGQPRPEATRDFLEAGRGRALAFLAAAWRSSASFNELHLLPGLIAEGNWQNEPSMAREKVISFAESAPADQWWSLRALVQDVRDLQPDFQRLGGDFDSWYLRDVTSGDYLRGFNYWDQVDGALIVFLLCGPMHWLGLVDLAQTGREGPALAFRWTSWSQPLLTGLAPEGLAAEKVPLTIDSQGQIQAGPGAPRVLRYQIARFCRWEGKTKGNYRYRVTARSLEAAQSQGLEIRQLIALLRTHAASPIPPNLLKAIQRWDEQGTEARLNSMMVLRVSSIEVIKAMKASRVSRYLGDPLGPTAIEVHTGAAQHVLRALTEMGYLGELEDGRE